MMGEPPLSRFVVCCAILVSSAVGRIELPIDQNGYTASINVTSLVIDESAVGAQAPTARRLALSTSSTVAAAVANASCYLSNENFNNRTSHNIEIFSDGMHSRLHGCMLVVGDDGAHDASCSLSFAWPGALAVVDDDTPGAARTSNGLAIVNNNSGPSWFCDGLNLNVDSTATGGTAPGLLYSGIQRSDGILGLTSDQVLQLGVAEGVRDAMVLRSPIGVCNNHSSLIQATVTMGIDLNLNRSNAVAVVGDDHDAAVVHAGSLSIDGLHPQYQLTAPSSNATSTPSDPMKYPPSIVWSEPLPSAFMPGYNRRLVFPLYGFSLCGVDSLPSTVISPSHWYAEVDTDSACLTLPGPIFDSVMAWLPVVNCGRVQGVGRDVAGTSPIACDLDDTAAAGYRSGSRTLPWLSFQLTTGVRVTTGVDDVGPQLLYLPIDDLIIPSPHIRGTDYREPTSLSPCILREPGSGTASSWRLWNTLQVAGGPLKHRIRFGSLTLRSLYPIFEVVVTANVSTTCSRSDGNSVGIGNVVDVSGISVDGRKSRVCFIQKKQLSMASGGHPYASCNQPAFTADGGCAPGSLYRASDNQCLPPPCAAGYVSLLQHGGIRGDGSCAPNTPLAVFGLVIVMVIIAAEVVGQRRTAKTQERIRHMAVARGSGGGSHDHST